MSSDVTKLAILTNWLRDAGERAKSFCQDRRGTVHELSHGVSVLTLKSVTLENVK